MGFCSAIESLLRCFCLRCFFSYRTEQGPSQKKSTWKKKQMQHLGTHRFLEFQDMLLVCFSLSSFLDCKICKTQATPNAGLTCPKSRKCRKAEALSSFIIVLEPPKKNGSQIRRAPTIDSPWPSFVSSVAWVVAKAPRLSRQLGRPKMPQVGRWNWGETRWSAQHLRYLNSLKMGPFFYGSTEISDMTGWF